jgi:hypothetical protein
MVQIILCVFLELVQWTCRNLNNTVLFWQKAPVEIIRAAYDVSFSPLIRIALQSNDQSELQVSFIFLLCVQHLLFFEKS